VLLGIFDLGINNLTSVQRAFSIPLRPTDKVIIVGDGQYEERPDLLILPGLGSFGAGMTALTERGLEEKIVKWTKDGSKLVGICLGMQLLGTTSHESPGVEGLNLIESRIERLPADEGDRIPHVGWAETVINSEVKFFPSLASPGDFYFVHSYHLLPEKQEKILSKTGFGKKTFASSVISQNILGVQFHPEKSGAKGMALISEIVQWVRDEG
jgi:glutamine amidotransferase